MTQLGDTLTTTGVIATMISVLFAVASMIIARRRKTHETTQPLHETPVASKDTLPLATETRSTSSPLFKRLGRIGIEATEAETGRGEQMIWE